MGVQRRIHASCDGLLAVDQIFLHDGRLQALCILGLELF